MKRRSEATCKNPTDRFLRFLEDILDLDQVGLMPAREGRDNTIKVLNHVYLASTKPIPSLLVAMDADKAFDRVNWEFIFQTYILEWVKIF